MFENVLQEPHNVNISIDTWMGNRVTTTLHNVVIDEPFDVNDRYIACDEFCRLILRPTDGGAYRIIDVVEQENKMEIHIQQTPITIEE